MKKLIIRILAIAGMTVILTSCASTIKTTGSFNYDSTITNMLIICNTPEIVQEFSNELCVYLETKLEQKGLIVKTLVIGEMSPTLNSDSKESNVSDSSDIVIKITHVRVSLYNGMPCNTLLNIEIISNKENKSIWAARVYTKGSNLTGPGDPERVSTEIINQMITDGLKI
jgi:hypothetical protein